MSATTPQQQQMAAIPSQVHMQMQQARETSPMLQQQQQQQHSSMPVMGGYMAGPGAGSTVVGPPLQGQPGRSQVGWYRVS